MLENVTDGNYPFAVEGDAPTNALFVGSNGNVGLGTSLPLDNLHIEDSNTAALRLLRNASGGTTLQDWQLSASNSGFGVRDVTASTFPFVIRQVAPSSSLLINNLGNIGLGLNNPEGKLHTQGDGTQLIYFESGDGGAVQVRFRSDSQNRRFLAVDNDDNVQTQMQFRDDEILFLGATSADEWLSVSAAGITTAGPTCSPNPCDRTFDPEHFTVPAIEERAAYMWENMHLPAAGPTTPGEPFNLTEKTTGMLHELEVAHIYIEQLNSQLQEEQATRIALEGTVATLSTSQTLQAERLQTLEDQLARVLAAR